MTQFVLSVKTLFKESVGMPSYKGIQPKAQIGTTVQSVVLRSLRRLRRTRTVCFVRIWRKKNNPFSIRMFQTYILYSSTVDLFLTVPVFMVFYLASNNTVARWLHLPIIMALFGFFRNYTVVLPILSFYLLNGYVLMYWLSCLYIPLYKEWLYYNLSYASVSQLAGDLPGKWAWKSVATLFVYLLVRMVDSYIRDWRLLKTTSRLLKESGLEFSAEDFIETYNNLHEVTPTYLTLVENFFVNTLISGFNFVQVLLSLFF